MRLSEEQTEQLTDLMVSKLAMARVVDGETTDPASLRRDEITLVIANTDILLGSKNPAATLEQWLAS